MANFVLQNSSVMVGSAAMTTYLNKVTMKMSVADLNATTFSGSHQLRLPGLKTVELQQDGLWDSAPDALKFAGLGTANQAVTVCPEGFEVKTAFLFQGGDFTYDQFGTIGELTPFSMSLSGTNPVGVVRGQLASQSRSINSAGQIGSILTIAGPTSTQFLYATFHVFTAGTTLTVLVESATTLGFAGPTTRATIGPLTTAGGTFMTRVAGPITDGFFRLNASVCTGTFQVAGAIGVQ